MHANVPSPLGTNAASTLYLKYMGMTAVVVSCDECKVIGYPRLFQHFMVQRLGNCKQSRCMFNVLVAPQPVQQHVLGHGVPA